MTNLRPNLFAAHSPADPAADWNDCHLLEHHLKDVADLANQFATSFGAGEFAYYAGLWHDLGKFRPGFQKYIRGLKRKEQSFTSHKWAGAAQAAANMDHFGPMLGNIIAFVIGCHHGGLQDFSSFKSGFKGFAQNELNEAKEAMAQAQLDFAPYQVSQAGIALPDNLQPPEHSPDPSTTGHSFSELLTRFIFSALIDADVLDTQRFWRKELYDARLAIRANQKDLEALEQLLEAHLVGFKKAPPQTHPKLVKLNQTRDYILQDCLNAAVQSPGFFTLTVPTGGGKTLASMAFALKHANAHQKRRIIVVLPFTSIIEQSAEIYRQVFGVENVLEHHSAVNWDAEELQELEKYVPLSKDHKNFFHPAKLLTENWDAPIVVTTAVQFLESLHAHQNTRCRKLHNIANSVVIMDEAQMLPQRFLDITLQTLQTLVNHFKTSIVLCTATQPAVTSRIDGQFKAQISLQKVRPIIKDENALFQSMVRVRVHWPENINHSTTLEELADRARDHHQALIITHRRLDARALAETLGEDWLHLSANMVPEHRSQVIATIKAHLDAAQACRVVATQVVEAGVDIDFPVVYRALAGIDSLAQAAGRCNRNNTRDHGDFYVFQSWTTTPPGLLAKGHETTVSMLRKGPVDLFDPATYDAYFRQLNSNVNTDEENCLLDRSQKNFCSLSKKYHLIDSQHTLPIIVPLKAFPDAYAAIQRIKAGYPKNNDFQLLQRATVNVPKPTVRSWIDQGNLEIDQKAFLFFIKNEAVEALYHDRLGLDIKPLSSDPYKYYDY